MFSKVSNLNLVGFFFIRVNWSRGENLFKSGGVIRQVAMEKEIEKLSK